jgi:hypothetical protein
MGESKVVLKMRKLPRRHVIYFIEIARVHHDTEEARASFLPRVAAVGSASLLALITLLLISKSRKAVRDSTPQ